MYRQPMFEAMFAFNDAILSGVIGAVSQPYAQNVAARRRHDLAAFDHVRNGLFLHR